MATEIGNRDLLEKIGKFFYEENNMSYSYYDNKTEIGGCFQGHAIYKDYQYQKYLISQLNADSGYGLYEDYMTENKIYRHSNNQITVDENKTPNLLNANRFSILTQSLFSEQAFAGYQNDVIKTIINVGYKLQLKMSWDDFYWYFDGVFYSNRDMAQRLVDFENFKTNMQNNCPFYEEMQMTTNIYFADNKIYALDFEGVMHSAVAVAEGSEVDPSNLWVKSVTTIKIKSYSGDITEPDWVTEYKAQQN